jgi:hypothetical protein
MRTVPAHVASLLATLPAVQHSIGDALASSGRQIGERVELDLDALAQATSPAVAEIVAAYHQTCQSFQANLASGAPAGAYIAVRRPLLESEQSDRKGARVDLAQELEELLRVPALGEFCGALLDGLNSPTRQQNLDRFGPLLDARLETGGANQTVATVALQGRSHPWPTQLGGPASPGEVRRVFTLTANHASWRDRRVRRLQRLVVEAEEVWPHPLVAGAAIARIALSSAYI